MYFVNNGLLRKNEFPKYLINTKEWVERKGVDAGDRFCQNWQELVILKPSVKLLDVFLSKF
jgi:GMP synthase PP-ATPase subunit